MSYNHPNSHLCALFGASLLWAVALGCSQLLAQEAQTAATEDVQIVIDETPFISARGAGMANALSTLADGFDAAHHNPAGIGGLYEVNRKNFIRRFYFPYGGMAANENALELNKKLKAAGANQDAIVTSAVLDSEGGKRQYARLSLGFGALMGNMLVLPFTDQQIAAIPVGDGSGEIDARMRSLSGFGLGLSASDKDKRFYLGFFSQFIARSDTAGQFTSTALAKSSQRTKEMKDAKTNYAGTLASNVGMIWRIAKTGAPALGVVVHDVGGTAYKASNAKPDLKVKQDLTLGFSYSPNLTKSSYLNFIVQADELLDEQTSVHKKYKTGLEWLVGGRGSDSWFGLRSGYNLAGVSYGLSLNLGILNFEVASHAEDIGVGNKHVVERRNSAVVYLDLAE